MNSDEWEAFKAKHKIERVREPVRYIASMSIHAKPDTDYDLSCGCVACKVCRGIGYDIEDSKHETCAACNGLCKSKMCLLHAAMEGWLGDGKEKKR